MHHNGVVDMYNSGITCGNLPISVDNSFYVVILHLARFLRYNKGTALPLCTNYIGIAYDTVQLHIHSTQRTVLHGRCITLQPSTDTLHACILRLPHRGLQWLLQRASCS